MRPFRSQTTKASGLVAPLLAKPGLSAGSGCTNTRERPATGDNTNKVTVRRVVKNSCIGLCRVLREAWSQIHRRQMQSGKSRSETSRTEMGQRFRDLITTDRAPSDKKRVDDWRERTRQVGTPSLSRHEQPDGDLPPAPAAGGPFPAYNVEGWLIWDEDIAETAAQRLANDLMRSVAILYRGQLWREILPDDEGALS